MTDAPAIEVVIADDEHLIRTAVAALLELEGETEMWVRTCASRR